MMDSVNDGEGPENIVLTHTQVLLFKSHTKYTVG